MNKESSKQDAGAARPSAAADTDGTGRGRLRLILIGALLVVLVISGLGMYWSQQPEKFDVRAAAVAVVGDEEAAQVPGVVTVSAAAQVAETLLSKPGGFLYNDMIPPSILIDNLSSWEYGGLTELRDSVRALRNDLSRSQTQSLENEHLAKADSEFNFDAESWFFPAAETEYREGIKALKRYLDALVAGNDQSARFFVRADNLGAYLAVVEKRLGSYGQRLSSSVGDSELTAALGMSVEPDQGAQLLEKTPWHEVDNVFYEARGYSWALLHMLKAISIDFEDVLKNKNAEVSLQQVLRDLEQATVRKWSPIVLNGRGFGMLANHSLVLASYMARANAAVLDLRQLLERG
jgi:hypothetical protein